MWWIKTRLILDFYYILYILLIYYRIFLLLLLIVLNCFFFFWVYIQYIWNFSSKLWNLSHIFTIPLSVKCYYLNYISNIYSHLPVLVKPGSIYVYRIYQILFLLQSKSTRDLRSLTIINNNYPFINIIKNKLFVI